MAYAYATREESNVVEVEVELTFLCITRGKASNSSSVVWNPVKFDMFFRYKGFGASFGSGGTLREELGRSKV